MQTAFLRSILAAGVLAATGAARAQSMPFQGYVEMPANLAPMVMGNQASELLRQVNKKHAPGGASTLAPAAGEASGPRALAAAAAPDRRADLEARLARVLSAWQQISSALHLPPDDVAGPVAACIAGSYMVVHDVDLPDADFVALVGQMRAVLQDNPRFTQALPVQRREMYEELAIIGTLLATGREAVRRGQASPQAGEALRRNARTNLDRLLGADADRAVIGAQGLALR